VAEQQLRLQHESNYLVRKIKMHVSDFRFLVESLAHLADDEIVTIQAFCDVLNENEPAYSVGYQWSASDNEGRPAKKLRSDHLAHHHA
jgi:hypothetical protein